MSNNSIKKCSKCNISFNQDYHKDFGYICSNEVEKQRRIFNKNGKHFCFNCLASEYELNCQYCHKRINSKDELAYWGGGILSINGDYDCCKIDDRVFTCWDCDEKIREKTKNGIKPSWCSGWGPILFPENRKCRIAGCSQKPYYECVDLCLPHSKPCKGGKIKPNGKRCNAAMGTDEGDICEFCQNQIETHQQHKDRLENESNRIYEQYKRAIEEAQSWWDSLSSEEKQGEIHSLEAHLPARIERFWNSHGYKNVKDQTQGNAQYPHWDTFENGKLYQSDTTRVPWAIVGEYFEGKRFDNSILKYNDDGNNYFPPNPSASQSITNQNDQSDNSVKVNPGNSPKPNPGKDEPSETKNNFETIRFEKSPANPTSEKSPNKTSDNKTLIINLNNIEKISLNAEGNLVIEFKKEERDNYSNSQTITLDQINSSQELQKVKNYLEKNNQNGLNRQELNRILSKSNNSVSPEKPKDDNNILLIGSIIFGTLLIVGMGIALFLRRKRKFKKN